MQVNLCDSSLSSTIERDKNEKESHSHFDQFFPTSR